ncbi:DUF4258 domain-containing protein [Flavobacteriaceae bacterium PRS1]|nr:DUF4258 domain-containing protein [Flavobacteriaceae bacterium PRS1]
MKLIHRIGYYLGGFSIGLIFLAFFLSGKKASCSYGLDARVSKNISTKQLVYSQNVLELLKNRSIDTFTISEILKFGDVDFSKVDRDLDFCKLYIIEHEIDEKDIALTVENCETIATIMSVSFE